MTGGLHKLCHEDSTFQAAQDPEQRLCPYIPRRISLLKTLRCQMLEKGRIGEGWFGFHDPLSLQHSVSSHFFLYEGHKKGQPW